MQSSPIPATRTVHLAVHLTSVILLAAYSGALISFLAVQIFTMPFTTMEGLLKDGTYRFGVVPNSAEYNLFSVINIDIIYYVNDWSIQYGYCIEESITLASRVRSDCC